MVAQAPGCGERQADLLHQGGEHITVGNHEGVFQSH
jgi:hypothetical protein